MGRTRLFGGNVATTLALTLAIGLTLVLTGCLSSPATSSTTTSDGYGAARESLTAAPQAVGGVAPMPGVPSKDLGAGTGTDASKIPADQRLIVRNKTMRIEVDAVSGAIDKLRSMATRDGADITQLQVATSNDQPVYRPMAEGDVTSSSNAPLQAYVTIRVPAAKYQAFIDEAAKLGKVLFQAENTDDVTQQHIDLKARLDNLKAEELRLRDFFTKAKNVTEMLQIEQELSRVRGEIESMAAQVAYLERQAAMATVTIELSEPKPLVRPTGTDWGVGRAFTDSIRAFVTTLNVLIVMLGPILALGLFIVLPAFLIVRVVWRIVRKRRAARVAEATQTAPDAPAEQ